MSTIMKASHQWMTRPADQRFVSLTEMAQFKNRVRQFSQGKVVSSRQLEVIAPDARDVRALQISGPNGSPVNPTNWSFDQLARIVKAPASYLRSLPAALTADCLNVGLVSRDVEDIGVLLFKDDENGIGQLSAVTGPNYGRVWDSQIIAAVIERFGDGVTGDFRVPGEFGKAIKVNRDNTTLYASDRDMFVFLADEKNRIEIPGRREGLTGSLARGFLVWNSEVGSRTFGVATFLFDYVCCNRIIWGAQEYREITIRHTSSAPDRWIEEVAPAIEAYAESSTTNIVKAIEDAKAKRLDMDVLEFLTKRRKFTMAQAKAIATVHEAEEARPMETIFDVVTGVTAYAKRVNYQDQRVDLEKEAGKIMDLAA